MSRTPFASEIAGRRWLAPALAGAVAIAVLVPGIGSYGFWEPHEIQVAESARELVRPAVGRGDEAAERTTGEGEAATGDGGEETPRPSLSERAVAASIDTFGVSEFTARLPMAILGLVALACAAAIGWRLSGPRAGLFAGAVLMSFPLLLFEARQLTGDIGAVAGHGLIALGAIGLVWPGSSRTGARAALYLVDAALVTAGAALGALADGLLLGVAVPAGAVALAGGIALAGARRDHRRDPDAAARPPALRWIGTAALTVLAAGALLATIHDAYDVVTAYPGDRALFGKTLAVEHDHVAALGGAWRESPDLDSAFTHLFEQVGYGLFPWSALAPIALGALALARSSGRRGFAGHALLASALIAWAVATWQDRAVAPMTFPALVAIAAAIGLFLDDVLRAREGGASEVGPALPLGTLFVILATAVLAKDLVAFPGKFAGVHLAGESISFPGDAKVHVVVLAVLGLVCGGALAHGLHGWAPRTRGRLAILRGASRHALHASIGASVLLAVYVAHVWMPAMATRLSSKGIFDAVSDLREPGQPLAVLGRVGSGQTFYARGELERLGNRRELVDFLDRSERAFALAKRGELCPINKAATGAGVNYHVIYDENADFMLLSNQLGEKQADENPLLEAIRREPPGDISHQLEANFDDRIRLLGADMPRRVERGDVFEMKLYYEVLKPVRRNWKVIVHIDGPTPTSRINGDHDPIDGMCGTAYWQEGDFIVDRFEVEAGGLSSPRGEYEVWTGFFVGSHGNFTNMEVASGPADETDRVELGTIRLD